MVGLHFFNSVLLYLFTLCLVGGIIGSMENKGRKIRWKTVFFTVWQKKENAEDGKPKRKFSLPGPQFTSSQIERKIVERKVLSPWNYTNALSYLPSSQTQRLFLNQLKIKIKIKKQRARAGEKKRKKE